MTILKMQHGVGHAAILNNINRQTKAFQFFTCHATKQELRKIKLSYCCLITLIISHATQSLAKIVNVLLIVVRCNSARDARFSRGES